LGNGKDKEFLFFISGKREWELSPSILITRNPNWSQRSGIGTGCVKRRCNNPDFFFHHCYFYIQVPPKFLPKFQQSLLYMGRSQVINEFILHFQFHFTIWSNHPGSNSTHHHQHNTSYSITLTMHNSIVTSYKLYLA